ncbi:DUF1365 family protein [Mesorhizobium sp. Root102]|uniref:DUF1365 family protein n=1 Tax=Mesorhizobium sp. Root102 TaxID=1736422 RepID=UPI0012E3B236|nr:DUF1365 family protein [Mesorhizobium sp. Root102]
MLCKRQIHAGESNSLGTAPLAACLLKSPLMTWKIVAGIHWEVLKLWSRGARFRPNPPITEPVSTRDQETAFEPGE